MFFVFFQCIINAIVAKLGMLIGTITLYYSYMLLTACLALIHELEVWCMCMYVWIPVLILILLLPGIRIVMYVCQSSFSYYSFPSIRIVVCMYMYVFQSSFSYYSFPGIRIVVCMYVFQSSFSYYSFLVSIRIVMYVCMYRFQSSFSYYSFLVSGS